MKDYSLGKIYKIISNKNGMYYVGSTCYPKLSQKLSKHKQDYKKYENGKGIWNQVYNFFIYDEPRIILLENYSCNNIDELHARQHYWEEQEKILFEENARKRLKESRKRYREKYKEQLAEKAKEYYETHKEEIAQKKKEYTEKNKEVIAPKQKKYYENNKEKIEEKRKEKIQCKLCNSFIRKYGLKEHQQSKKCINAIPKGIINEITD